MSRGAPALTEALQRDGVAFRRGRCVVEASADEAARILAVVRRLELPLGLAFNRERVMVLPHGICRSAGLREALHALLARDPRPEEE